MQHIQSVVGEGLPGKGLGGQRMDIFPLLSSHIQQRRGTTACWGSKMNFSAARGDPSSFHLRSPRACISVWAPRFRAWETLDGCGSCKPKSTSLLLFLFDLGQRTFPPWPSISFPEKIKMNKKKINVSYTVLLRSPESIPEVI